MRSEPFKMLPFPVNNIEINALQRDDRKRRRINKEHENIKKGIPVPVKAPLLRFKSTDKIKK
jgi:hypothetical protein